MKLSDETKCGFFGGTFDPIHFGHINLALQIKEKFGLEKVLFCPTYITPLKANVKTSAKHRSEMVALSISDISGFEFCDIEIKNENVSYTINTIKELKKKYRNLYLIIADDSINNFDKWKKFEEIIKLAPPIIGIRDGGDKNEVLKNLKNNFIETSIMEISSSDIRERIKKGLYVKHLLPTKVLDYINNYKLY